MKFQANGPEALGGTARFFATVISITLAVILPVFNAEASMDSWSTRDGGETIQGELEGFDFVRKEMIYRDANDAEHRISTADLDTSGRIQLLISPEFARSFPEESFSREQGQFILLGVGIPASFLLLSFFLCAGFLLRSLNPIRAVIGWCGSVVLGSFLAGFYVFLSARSEGAALGITLFGIIVVSGLLSLYVSIIYRTTVLNGLKVLVLHVFGALFLIFGTVLAVKFAADPATTETFLEERIFKPVGLI